MIVKCQPAQVKAYRSLGPHPLLYLHIDGPFHASRTSEGTTSDRVFHIAKNEQVKEEPTNNVNELIVACPLLVIH